MVASVVASPTHGRLRAALFGSALGDAVGAPFEGRSRIDRSEIHGWLAADELLRWTDDTHMALALGRTLRDADGALDQQQLGDAFAADYHAEPWRGYGAGPPRVFALARRGTPYVEAAGSLFGNTGSFGNGAAMRVTPVALAAGGDEAHATELATAQSQVTHTHVEAVDGAVFVASAVCRLARSTGGRADVLVALNEACQGLAGDTIRAAIEFVLDLAAQGGDVVETVRARGTGVAARESVPAAVAAVLVGDDLTSTLVAAIELGGDTDTIAAMAGALAGARYGEGSLPTRLLERLEAREEIGELAAALLASAADTR
jgi:poly(ADP-ribose) glycohydrolase ARH3